MLRSFLEWLTPDELKQQAIGHSIVQAARPRSVIVPLLLGLGVELDHVFRSKWLINHLSRFGFSVTHDEVTRYKQSVVEAKEEDPRLHSYPASFTQWVADNVDHNQVTLDGLGTFHGMGIIAISTRASESTVELREKAFKRLKRARVASIAKGHGIDIQLYCSQEPRSLASLSFTSMDQIHAGKYVQPPSVHLDLVWGSGWLLADCEHPQSNWSGFMQHACNGDHPSEAKVLFLPIININPSDEHCIYSTLRFVEKQALQLNIETPCITFDQPLWLKAIEIVISTSMNMVCRLGGFHTLMSFLGSIGTLMGDVDFDTNVAHGSCRFRHQYCLHWTPRC